MGNNTIKCVICGGDPYKRYGWNNYCKKHYKKAYNGDYEGN